MNRKGFTLVELLAIIVIIAAISTFALVNIDKKKEVLLLALELALVI